MVIPGIIYPPTLDFDFLVQRPQQLLKALSRLGVTIYFINRPGHNRTKLRGIEKYNEHFYLFHQLQPSFPDRVRPVVYYSNPGQTENIMHSYNHSLLVFDSLDEPTDEFASWQPYYHQAVASADLVLAASDKLYSQAREINPNTLLIPNGCDYDYFTGSREHLPPPLDLPELNAAVTGYIGVIASWFDLELLERAALAFPRCSFLIIGPLYNVHNIPLYPNIHWLGYKDYEELINYACYFDAGIIPFKTSDMTRAVNPIKMWEYMAMGIPVVTTELPEVSRYRDIMYPSHSHQDFINNLHRALKNESWQRCEQRMSIARENSWLARARQILLAIQDLLQDGKVNNQESLPVPAETIPYRRKYYHEQMRMKFLGTARKHKITLSGGRPCSG